MSFPNVYLFLFEIFQKGHNALLIIDLSNLGVICFQIGMECYANVFKILLRFTVNCVRDF